MGIKQLTSDDLWDKLNGIQKSQLTEKMEFTKWATNISSKVLELQESYKNAEALNVLDEAINEEKNTKNKRRHVCLLNLKVSVCLNMEDKTKVFETLYKLSRIRKSNPDDIFVEIYTRQAFCAIYNNSFMLEQASDDDQGYYHKGFIKNSCCMLRTVVMHPSENFFAERWFVWLSDVVRVCQDDQRAFQQSYYLLRCVEGAAKVFANFSMFHDEFTKAKKRLPLAFARHNILLLRASLRYKALELKLSKGTALTDAERRDMVFDETCHVLPNLELTEAHSVMTKCANTQDEFKELAVLVVFYIEEFEKNCTEEDKDEEYYEVKAYGDNILALQELFFKH